MITIININLTLRQHWPQITNTQTADSDDIINIIYRIDNTFLYNYTTSISRQELNSNCLDS